MTAVLSLCEGVEAAAVLRLLIKETSTRRFGSDGAAVGRDLSMVAVLRSRLFPLGDNLADRLVGSLEKQTCQRAGRWNGEAVNELTCSHSSFSKSCHVFRGMEAGSKLPSSCTTRRLPFSPTISRVDPLRTGFHQRDARHERAREEETHQEKSSICQKLTMGRTNEKNGMAIMYKIIHPMGDVSVSSKGFVVAETTHRCARSDDEECR